MLDDALPAELLQVRPQIGESRTGPDLANYATRLGKPEEVAGLIIYLCSEEAAFVTGANIAINGGQHMQ